MLVTEKEREGQQEKGRAVYHVCDKEREGQQEKGRAVYHVCEREFACNWMRNGQWTE